MNASDFLKQADEIMQERGKTYDKASTNHKEERSAKSTAEAFNAVTGKTLTESDIWLIMLLLKQVRQYSTPEYHHDSALDSVAYAALLSESLNNAKKIDKAEAIAESIAGVMTEAKTKSMDKGIKGMDVYGSILTNPEYDRHREVLKTSKATWDADHSCIKETKINAADGMRDPLYNGFGDTTHEKG